MSENIPSINSKVFQLGGLNFIVGLYWRTISGGVSPSNERPKKLGKLVISRAGKNALLESKKVNSDTIAVRQFTNSHPVQIGLGQRKYISGFANSHIYSWPQFIFEALAAYKQDASELEGVCVVYPTNNDSSEYLLAIQNQGLIIPSNGDIYDSLDNVTDIISEMLSTGGFKVFAPKELNIPGAEELPGIDLLINAIGKTLSSCELNPITPNYQKIAFSSVSLAVLFFGLYSGYSSYQEMLQAERDAAAQAAMAALLESQNNELKSDDLPILINSPKPTFQACLHVYKNIRINAGGWRHTSSLCKDSNLTVIYKRQASQIKYLQSIYPKAEFSIDGNEATIIKNVKWDKLSIDRDSLPTQSTLINMINGFAQTMRTSALIQVRAPALEPELPGRSTEELQLNRMAEVDWQIEIPFEESINAFNVPGTSLDAVLLTQTESGKVNITIKGTSYVKN